MTALADAEARSLVLHQFIALRRAGASALDAVNRLVEGLTDGPLRAACREAALSFSATAPAESNDDLVRVLSDRTDDVTRAAVLADSYVAAAELSAARRSGRLVLQVLVAGPLVGLAVLGLFTAGERFLEPVPAPTQLLLDLVGVMRVAGVPVAVFLALALSRWSRVPVFGAASLEASRALYVASSHAEPVQAASAVVLNQVDRAVLLVLTRRAAPADARAVVLELARRLEREGRRRVEVHHLLSSLLLGGLGAMTIGGALALLYLPIFTIAGNIQ